MSYTRFDRHSCFTSEMRTMTMDIINATENDEFTNMAYGLFDGYLYDDLLPKAIKLGVSKDIENKIKGLIKAIEMYLLLTKPTIKTT